MPSSTTPPAPRKRFLQIAISFSGLQNCQAPQIDSNLEADCTHMISLELDQYFHMKGRFFQFRCVIEEEA